jgi:uncharacterized protein YggE
MDRYIEVIGEGEFIETAARFITQIDLTVRAAKDETALKEVAELGHDVLVSLRKSGIYDDEIVEGGTDYYQPWYWKKQVGQTAARKIILKVTDFTRLNQALTDLEPLQSRHKERKTIAIDMRQPEFETSSETKALALAAAFEDAKVKALRLAAAMNCQIGNPIHVEEGGWSKRNSGFSGDYDWDGDGDRFARSGYALMMGGAIAEEPESAPELQRPTRTIFVKCRVRFSISGNASQVGNASM